MVTGGSSGLGLGVVEALAARGAKIMVVARDAQRLAEVEHRLGVVGAVGDVTDRALAVSLLQEFLLLARRGRAEFRHHSFRLTNPTTIFAWAPMRYPEPKP
jgi:NAD(P)-dependent dehydrogenase (short-subunit alcohol dehydrogenase family)